MDRFAAVRRKASAPAFTKPRSEEHTSELQSHSDLVCRLLLEKKKMAVRLRARAPGRPQRPRSPSSSCGIGRSGSVRLFFFNDTATTEIYTLSLHDALPI